MRDILVPLINKYQRIHNMPKKEKKTKKLKKANNQAIQEE